MKCEAIVLVNFALLVLSAVAVSFDRLSLQTMLTRPIVCAPVLGAMFGQFSAGIVIGTWLELMWIDKAPLGNYVPPNGSYLAVIAVGALGLASVGEGYGRLPILVALFILLPLAYLGKLVDIWIFTRNEKHAREAQEAANLGLDKKVAFLHVKAMKEGMAIATLFICLTATGGALLIRIVTPMVPTSFFLAADYIYYFFPPILWGVALNAAYRQGDIKLFLAAGIVGLLVGVLVYGNLF